MARFSPLGSAIAGLLVAVTLAGCTSSSASGWTLPSVPTEVPHFTANDSLPFDSYTLPVADLERMQTEQAAMLTECAEQHGLQVTFGGDYIRPADASYVLWGGRPGTMNLDHAAEYGYHPGPKDDWASVGGFYLKDPTNVQAVGASDPEASAILYGAEDDGGTTTESSSPGGCFSEVDSKIGGALAPITSATSVTNMSSELINLTLTHPEVKSADARWRTCMKMDGFDFKSVQAASESFTMTALSEQEISTATADVKCTESSRWADIFYFVLEDYQEQAIKRQTTVLENSLSALKDRLRLLDSFSASPSS